MCELFNKLLVVVGVLVVEKLISFKIVYCIGVVVEWLWLLLWLCGELLMMCFFVEQLCMLYWYSMELVWCDFGYVFVVSIDEGFMRLKVLLCGEFFVIC